MFLAGAFRDSGAGRWLFVSGLLLLSLSTGCRWLSRRPSLQLAAEQAESLPFTNRLQPSHNREWSADLAVLPFAEIAQDQATIHNIRDCTYRTDDDYVVKYYDKTFDLDEIKEVNFIVVPFVGAPSLAHTLLSFGFKDAQYVSVSVEARLEKGEKYSPALGAMRQFELMYVVADERDVILRRTKFRGSEVYLYRTRATPEQARDLFLDVLNRVNQIYRTPEFYDTLTNNCTSNIVEHINRLRPNSVNLYDPRVLLPGYADNLAYDLGLLDSGKSFEQLQEEARIRERANRYANRRNFSELIRQ